MECSVGRQSGLFVGDDKLAFVSLSDGDDDQESYPRANRAGGEIAGARIPAWDPQLNELERPGACGE